MAQCWYYEMDTDGETPMSRAMKCGHAFLAMLLMRQEEEEDRHWRPHLSPGLHEAAYWGHAEAVLDLLESGANPDQRDERGELALHKAVRRGHLDAVRVLVEHGAGVNETDESGLTALHWAALTGQEEVAAFLIHHGIDLNHQGEGTGGLTPLAVAKLMGYDGLTALLADCGAEY